MYIVWLTALGIGGATMLGTLLGFLCKSISHRFSDIVLAFAAGVMLSAAILGLILPAIAQQESSGILICIAGILSGAFSLSMIDRFVPHIQRLLGWKQEIQAAPPRVEHVILFLAAMAIHNFPEGLAAGVSFGSSDVKNALMISGGIALQNIPEGLVTVTPMIAAGISPKKALLCGLATGVIEIIGTMLGYFAITVSKSVLPFALSFAGGTMLFVVSDEMIPETHDHGNERAATYSLLIGFCLMLISDVLLS